MIRTAGLCAEPAPAEVEGYAIQPRSKAIPSSERTKISVGFEERFLCYVLGIVEVMESLIGECVDTCFILVYEEAKRS